MIQLSQNISEYIHKTFGAEYLKKYEDYSNSEYTAYVRIDEKASDVPALLNILSKYGIVLEKLPEFSFAYKVLEGKEVIGKTVEFALGKYYIQSLSSMIPAAVLNPTEEDITLDLCAAPGSKTTQLSELMNNKGTLYANEVSLDRIKSLVFNLDKMNILNLGVIHYKGELLSKIFENYFDKILVDAPCSALGIVQKKGEVSNWWSENHAEKISEVQLKLLVSAVKMLKVGGEVVYSTCTMTIEENEFVLNKVLKNHPVELVKFELPIKSHPGITKTGDVKFDQSISKAKRILPWEVNSEGFFVAKLKKIGETEPTKRVERKKPLKFILNSRKAEIKNLLPYLCERFGLEEKLFENYKYLVRGKDVLFFDKGWETDIPDMFNRIGTYLGSIDKHGRLNIHTNAARLFGDKIKKNIVELSNQDELREYFNGGTIKSLAGEYGQKIVKYKDYILGTAVSTEGGLKSQFPRAMRTGEIIFAE